MELYAYRSKGRFGFENRLKLLCVSRDIDEKTTTTKLRAFRIFHQFAKLLKKCSCYVEVLLMTMTSLG